MQDFDFTDRVAMSDEVLEEMNTSEYLVFIFALETFLRYLRETEQEIMSPHMIEGVRMIRRLESVFPSVVAHLKENLPTEGQKKMVDRAAGFILDRNGLPKRVLLLRTALERGGAATITAVFPTNRFKAAVRAALAASVNEDADAALDVFKAITLRNKRVAAWIEEAAKIAVPMVARPVNPVTVATATVAETQAVLQESKVAEDAANPTSAVVLEESRYKEDVIKAVEDSAKESAKKAIEGNGELDTPPTKSEVVGIAAAMIAAATADTDESLPPAIKRLRDPEQRDVAMATGRVVVQAGAGSGKTTSVVSMLQYLVEDKGVPPEKIFVGVFNVEAANTIVTRARKIMGDEKVGQMALGTMHSRFLKSILKYGTGEIREAFTKRVISDRSPKSPNPFITPSQINGVMAQVWEACFGDSRPLPKGVSTQMEKWKFNDIPPDQALAEALDRNEQSLAIWYEWQAGFKGHLGPNWKPPCVGNRVPSKQEFDFNGNLKSPNKAESKWWTFVAKYRTGQDGRLGEKLLVDQTDMILKFRDLLRDNPAARKEIQDQFSHIIFDEAQDLSKVAHQIADYLGEKIKADSTDKLLMFIGDTNQAVNCVDVETPVNTPEGFKRAGDLVPGDTVLSYRNGSVVKQVVSGTLKTSPTEGVKVTTRSGNTLTMTKQHRIWADTAIDPSVGEYIVYLMYRSGFGYRVGVTSTGYNGSGYLRLAMRARSELAESMWVLKVCKTVSEALIEEETVSLNFGVPKCVFNGHYRDLDQERLNEVFKRFGHNGVAILENMGANSDLPHWRPSSFTGSDLDHRGSSRRIMQMIAHTPKGTLVTLEWTGEDLLSKIKDHLPGVSVSKAKDTSSGLARYRFRKHFNKYQEASAFAEHASSVLGTTLNRRIFVEESTPLMLVHAGGLQPGMQVISLGEDGEVFLDPIVSVDVVQGDFVDLEVTDAANFFGGGILSHNSFVGGSPKHMADRYTSGFQLKTIRANHRCLPEIVEAANRLMSNHPKTIPFEAVPDPAKPRGQASIEVMSVPDQSIAANNVTRRWLNEVAISGEDFSKYAVLSRTRRELDTYEMACILNGVPYSRKGAGSFLQAPEMKTVVGYMNLATSNDYKSLKKSLAHVINTPNRFFLKGDVDKDALIDSAINQLARSRGVNSEQVDPLDLLTTGDGLKAMVYALKIPRSLNFRDDWRGRQAEELLENLGNELMRIRSNVASNANADPSQPVSYSTSELINDILNIEGLPEGPAREKKPVKVLDVLVPPLKRLDDEEGSEKVEDPEEAALGTVYFLKTLAQGSKAMENKGLRAENPDDFIQYIRSLNDAAKDLRVDVKAWNAEQEALYPDNPELRKKAPAVTLSTIHSIKGAEWPDTTVIMTHGTFPFTPRPLDNEDKLDPEQQARLAARREEEFLTERQLAYVAMTRASEKLTIVSQNRFRGLHIPPSQFIIEAGLVTGENVTGQPDAIPTDGGEVRTAGAAAVPYGGFFVENGEYL